jgi:FtsP/CotA-like multicopper oxidase with cupredoxin domain
MNRRMVSTVSRAAFALVCAMTMTGTASAAEFYLWAGTTATTMPDSVAVPMWGFAEEPDADFSTLEGTVVVPGPALEVPAGDTTLTVHLYNNLTAPNVPVSIVIPGQITSMAPQFFTDDVGRQRVRSFTQETSPGATVTYTWTGLKPGTYLYHSGTHPQVQVQMGLYGAVTVNATTSGQAYDSVASAYDQQVVLLYSEIDPVLHSAVDGGNYVPFGDPDDPSIVTSTIDYNPKYFLVNGKPYPDTPSLSVGNPGQSVLIRFLNAGLRTHAPVLLGTRMRVIAEDGNLYPFPRDRCALELPAGQTKDAIVQFPAAGSYPVYDRSLNLSNAGDSAPGGMLTYLEVSAAP